MTAGEEGTTGVGVSADEIGGGVEPDVPDVFEVSPEQDIEKISMAIAIIEIKNSSITFVLILFI